MTKPPFTEKFDDLLQPFMQSGGAKGDQLFTCGGIEPAAYDDDYTLPRIIFTAAVEDQKDIFRPHGERSRSAVRNLAHF